MAQASQIDPVAQTESGEQPYPSTFYAWYCVFILFGIYINSFLDRQILSLMVDDFADTKDVLFVVSGRLLDDSSNQDVGFFW